MLWQPRSHWWQDRTTTPNNERTVWERVPPNLVRPKQNIKMALFRISCYISLFLLDKGSNPKKPNHNSSYQKPGQYILQEYQDVVQHQNSSRFYGLFPVIVAETRAAQSYLSRSSGPYFMIFAERQSISAARVFLGAESGVGSRKVWHYRSQKSPFRAKLMALRYIKLGTIHHLEHKQWRCPFCHFYYDRK